MEFGEHWYDRLWGHMLDAAAAVDEDKFDELMDIRADFGAAQDKEEIHAAKILFENWEEINACS